MYAIVDIAGQQFKVEKDQKLFVHRLEAEEGKKVNFDQVLLIDSGSKISVGDPLVKGASVSAKVITHMKADKVLVFKKKRRKGYQKLNGHRQYMTQIQIESISEKGSVKADETVKTEPKAAATPKASAKADKTETKSAKADEKKPAAAKKPAAKTAAAKPAAEKKPAAAKKPAAKKASPKKDADKE
jgi:large subunit ribosomal protein L21